MATAENHLIALLPRKDRQRLLALCEPVQLILSDVLPERDQPTRHADFPNKGFIWLITQIENHPGLEVGMVGREGMLGAQLAMGVLNSPLHAVVQGPGTAWRINTKAFRKELAISTALQPIMSRYLYVLMAQLASSATCLRFHQIGPRLARWLLMSQDRAQSDQFHVTQRTMPNY